MPEFELGAVQARFAELLWQRVPIGSGEVVKLCAEQFGWKKSTTYTVLHKLEEKGLFRNDGGTVKACLTREQFNAGKSEQVISESFGGSLPAFVAAFTAKNDLTAREAEEIRAMIDRFRKA